MEGNDENSGSARQNVSFKFSKSSFKSLLENPLQEEDAKDFVLAVDKSEIKSTLSKPKSKELVIPMIKKNNWRVSNKSDALADEESKITDIAIQELLKESSEQNAAWENRDSDSMSIPLIMQNKVPEGYETDDKMDVSLRPDQSSLEDYDRVPIEHYGLAMLRGMGWTDGNGIGKSSKIVKPVEVQLRPKGLGLGADASALKKPKHNSKEEKLELIKGAYVTVVQGPHKGFYGQVVGLDEENARAFIRLSGDDKIKSLPEFFICVVTKKEYEKESRIINKASYETYKRKTEEQGKGDRKRDKHDYHDHSSRSESEQKNRDFHSYEEHYKRQLHSSERSKRKDSVKVSKLWIVPQLKVRLIDDKYKKGKYFNAKMTVVDVFSVDSCACKTEDNKYLDDICPSMLETVIPRHEGAYVMIVQGKYRGELCTILERNKSNCVATVQFLSDRKQALKIEYDSICEYVGDIDQFD